MHPTQPEMTEQSVSRATTKPPLAAAVTIAADDAHQVWRLHSKTSAVFDESRRLEYLSWRSMAKANVGGYAQAATKTSTLEATAPRLPPLDSVASSHYNAAQSSFERKVAENVGTGGAQAHVGTQQRPAPEPAMQTSRPESSSQRVQYSHVRNNNFVVMPPGESAPGPSRSLLLSGGAASPDYSPFSSDMVLFPDVHDWGMDDPLRTSAAGLSYSYSASMPSTTQPRFCHSCRTGESAQWHQSVSIPPIVLCQLCLNRFSTDPFSDSSMVLADPHFKSVLPSFLSSDRLSLSATSYPAPVPSFHLQPQLQHQQPPAQANIQKAPVKAARPEKKAKAPVMKQLPVLSKQQQKQDETAASKPQQQQHATDDELSGFSSESSESSSSSEDDEANVSAYEESDGERKARRRRKPATSQVTRSKPAPVTLSVDIVDEPTATPSVDPTGNVCANCEATHTSLWRRPPDLSAGVWCNACALYFKLHHRARPLSMKRDEIRKRKRVRLTEFHRKQE